MENKVNDFITSQGLKQYFSGSLPYCVINDTQIPVLLVNENKDYTYDKKGYQRSTFEIDKYLLPKNTNNLIVKKRNDNRLILLQNCKVEDIDFSFVSKYKIRISVLYSSFVIVSEQIKYKAGNGFYVFDNLLDYSDINSNENYNGIPYFEENCFKNNMAGGIDTATGNSRYASLRLTDTTVTGIPSFFFEKKPFFVNLKKKKILYAYFPTGLSLLGFDIGLSDRITIRSTSSNMLCHCDNMQILNDLQIRSILIDNLLKDL